MYLFARRARLAPGNTAASMTWATNITEKVNQITGIPISLFMQVLSPEVGVLTWSTFAPDLATLEAATDKLNVDGGYISLLDEGAKFAPGGADDFLGSIIHGESEPNRQVEYVTTVSAVCAAGALTKGVEVGIEIAQRAEKAIGEPTMFVTSATGSYGSVMWITGHTDIQAMDTAQQKLAADAKFGEFVDKSVKGVYLEAPMTTQNLIFRRIA